MGEFGEFFGDPFPITSALPLSGQCLLPRLFTPSLQCTSCWGHLAFLERLPLAGLHLSHRDLPRLCPTHSRHTGHYSAVLSVSGPSMRVQTSPHSPLSKSSIYFPLSLTSGPQGMPPGGSLPAPSPDPRPPWGGEAGHTDDSLQRNPPHHP